MSVFCAVVVFSALYFLNNGPISITKVSVIGGTEKETDAMSTLVRDKLSERLFGFLPQNNFLLLDRAKLTSSVRKSFPEVGSISTRFNSLSELIVQVEQRAPYAYWCDKKKTNCLYMDAEGLAFGQAQGIASTSLGFYTDILPALNSSFDASKLEKYKAYVKAFEQAGFPVRGIFDQGSDLYLRLANGGEVRAVLSDNAEEVASRLSAVSESVKQEPEKSIDYIDLRFGSKVFLKRK